MKLKLWFSRLFLIIFLLTLTLAPLSQIDLLKVHAQTPTPAPAAEDPSQLYIETAKELLRRLFNLGNPDANSPSGGSYSTGGDGTSGSGSSGNTTQASPKLISILDWNNKINAALQTGLGTYYNKMLTNIDNGGYSAVKRQGIVAGTGSNGLYWCTNSIIDSYNLAGLKGLGLNHQSVLNMRRFFADQPSGYKYLDYRTGDHEDILKKVHPGYAMLMQSVFDHHTANGQHVNMIKTINIDSRGDGTITTYDSNSSSKGHTYPVDGWTITKTKYPVVGFGGI